MREGHSGSLLGSVEQFCASFFHIEPTPEGGIPEMCLSAALGGLPCPRKTVVCVARLQQQSQGAHVANGNIGMGAADAAEECIR